MLMVKPATIRKASKALPLEPAKMRGTTGRTHGEKTDKMPRAKAISSSSIKIEKELYI
jgi:hypothetical protein